jgi:LPS sulfotransferase NodH
MPRPLLILARQRSGTSALRKTLASSPQVIDVEEFLVPHVPLHPLSWHAFWRASGRNFLQESPSESDIDGYLTFCGNPHRSVILDGKLSSLGLLRMHHESPCLPPLIVRYFINHDLPILILERKHHVNTFISAEFARRTGVWHCTHSCAPEQQERLTINLADLQHYLDMCRQESLLLRKWVDRCQNAMHIYYEDLFSKDNARIRAPLLEQIATLMRVDASKLSPNVPTTKLLPNDLSTLVTNYHDAMNLGGFAVS